jgi:hypothetical protein
MELLPKRLMNMPMLSLYLRMPKKVKNKRKKLRIKKTKRKLRKRKKTMELMKTVKMKRMKTMMKKRNLINEHFIPDFKRQTLI